MSEDKPQESSPQSKKKSRLLRWLIRFFIIFFVLVSLLIGSVFTLPQLISTEWFSQLAVEKGSQFLNRPIHLGSLSWTWSEGIVIESFEIEDDPSFSSQPLVRLNRLTLDTDFKALLSRRAVVDFHLNGLDIQLIRNKQGKTNLELFLAGLPKPSEEEKKPEKKEPFDFRQFSLPLDIQTQIHLTSLSLTMDDREQSKMLIVKDGAILIDTESLINKPTTVKVSAHVELDGKELPPIELKAEAEKVFNNERFINLPEAEVIADASVAGITLTARVKPGTKELKSKVEIALNETIEIGRPFLPHPLSETDVKGTLLLTANASADSNEKIIFKIALNGQELGVSGGIVENKAIGPLSFEIENNGYVDIKGGSVVIDRGQISLLNNSSLSFKTDIENIFEPQPKIDFHLGPVLLDLKELYALSDPFMPPHLSLTLKGVKNTLSLDKAFFSGTPPPGQIKAALSNLTLNLANLDFKTPALNLTLKERKNTPSMVVTFHAIDFIGDLSSDANSLKTKLKDVALHLGDINLKNGDLHFTSEGGKKSRALSFTLHDIDFSGDLSSEANFLKTKLKDVALHLDDINLKNGDLHFTLAGGKKSHALSFTLHDIDFSGKTPLAANPLKAAFNNLALNLAGLNLDNQNLNLTVGGSKRVNPVTFTISDFALSGKLPSGSDTLKMNNLVFSFPRLSLKAGQTGLNFINFQNKFDTIDMTLKNFFPYDGTIAAALYLEKTEISGTTPVFMSNIEMAPVNLTFSKLLKNNKALFGVSSQINLKKTARLGDLEIPSRVHIKELKHSVDVDINLAPQKLAEISRANFDLSSSSLNVTIPELGTIKTDLNHKGSVGPVALRNLEPFTLDIANFNSSLAAGKFLNLTVKADAKDLAKKYVKAQSKLNIDLEELLKILPHPLRSQIKISQVSGRTDISMNVSGRLPDDKETNKLKGKTLTEKVEGLEFLKKLDLSFSAKNLSAKVPLSKGQHLIFSRVTTQKPFTFSLSETQKGTLQGTLKAQVDQLPALKPLKKPLTLLFDLSVDNESIRALKLSESLEIQPLNLKQKADISFTGLDRVLSSDYKNIAALLIRHVKGDIQAGAELGIGGDLSILGSNMKVKGRLETGTDIRLIPLKELSLQGWMKSPGMDLNLAPLLALENLQSHLVLEKKYKIMRRVSDSAFKRKKRSSALSHDVLSPLSKSAPQLESNQYLVQRLLKDMRGRFRQQRSLSFDSARIASEPLPLKFTNQVLDFRLNEGLPTVDYFQIDVLGGTLICSLALTWEDGEFFLNLKTAFTGINTKKLAPQLTYDVSDDDAEISGQMSVRLPLSLKIKSLLQSLELDLEITHIGSRTLERFLFALDPYESNETIVNQRKLLKSGTPRWIQVFIKYGNLDMTGSVSIKGITISLPAIKRLNVGNLPGMDTLESKLSGLQKVIETLKYMASDSIGTDRKGNVHFLYKGQRIISLN